MKFFAFFNLFSHNGRRLDCFCLAAGFQQAEDQIAYDGGSDDGGHEEATTTDAMRLFKKPSGGGAADDGSDGEGRFMDGHAQRAVGAAGNAMEHAVRVGMRAEDAGYGDEHDDGGGARREAEEEHVDGQQQMPDNQLPVAELPERAEAHGRHHDGRGEGAQEDQIADILSRKAERLLGHERIGVVDETDGEPCADEAIPAGESHERAVVFQRLLTGC